MRNNKSMIVQELEQSLNEQAPPSQPDTSGLHELPPLNIDGIPTPVDKMTQVIHLIMVNQPVIVKSHIKSGCLNKKQ